MHRIGTDACGFGCRGVRMKLRICFVVESGTDVRLLEGLAAQMEVRVLARFIKGGRAVNHPPRVPIPLEVGPANRVGFGMFVARHLWQQRRNYDLVLVQGYGLAALAANANAVLTGAPTCMLVCSPVEEYYRCRQIEPSSGKPFRWTEWFGLRAMAGLNAVLGQHYVVLSKHLAEIIQTQHHRREVAIIPVYGVDTSLFIPARTPKAQIKRALGLPDHGQLIFFSSRVAPEKDAAGLLTALHMLRSAGMDLWLLHRSGGYREFLALAQKYGVADRVLVGDALHPINELPVFYQACDLCVQTSHAEGLGFSPLEALACEVPVVATAVGGLCENIRDGETGWTCPPRDPAALARQISAALSEPNEARRRSVAGRSLVQAKFESERVFCRLAGFFDACVGKSPSVAWSLVRVEDKPDVVAAQEDMELFPPHVRGERASATSLLFRDLSTKNSHNRVKTGPPQSPR
jgi:glycosyltransferase involved in cell wall biosynthesis